MKLKGALAPAVALGAALAFGGGFLGAAPAYAKVPPQTMGRPVALKLQAAQKALQKGDNASALKNLEAASALPAKDKSPYATHVLHALYYSLYAKTRQYKKLIPEIEILKSDPWATPKLTGEYTVELTQLHYQLHNYDEAIKYGTVCIQNGWGGKQMSTLVGQAYYLKGDWRGTIRFEKQRISAAVKSGAKPSQRSLQLVQSSCMRLHDDSCLLDAMQQLVLYYPQPKYWQYLLYTTFKTIKSDKNLLQAYRLAFDVGVMQQPHEFTDYAELAIEANDPGEAQTVLTKALKANVFVNANSKAKAKRLLEDAKKKAAKDLAGALASTAAAAARQSTGESDVRVGLAYFGYQQYDKAVKEFTQGIAKGGLKDPAEAQLLLGIAQLKAGNKGAALKAFKDVKGNDVLQRLASLWSLKARSAA